MDNRKAVVERIRQIEIQRQSGSLYLVCGDPGRAGAADLKEVIRIYFEEGLISAISSSSEDDRCGQYFLKEGLIGPSELHRLLSAKNGVPFPLGEGIVGHDLAAPLEVRTLLYRLALQVFGRAIDAGFGVDSFEPVRVPFQIPLAVDLDTLLLELARLNPETRFRVEPEQKISLVSEHDFFSLPWSPEELAILDGLCEPRTIEELVQMTGLQEDEVRFGLNTFHQLALIELRDAHPEAETAALATRPPFPLGFLVPRVRSALMSDQLETARNEHSFTSEQFASLKVRLKESAPLSTSQVLAVTSPNLEDGKSLVCVNLAFSCARDPGSRTIIVDLDLRKPSVHQYIGISLEPGLIGYLTSNLMKPSCFMRRVGDLYVMTAGGTSEKSVELLSLKKTRELMEYLKSEFDLVLLDTPPLYPISDTRIISSFADGMVVVIRRGKTPHSITEKAMSSVDRKKIRGVVFNDVKPMMFHTYYNYSYYRPNKASTYPYKSGARQPRRRH